jgi:putative transcriptional regulator
MKEKDFKKLLQGIKEIHDIRKGTLKPGRVFKFDPIEVKRIRAKLHQSQEQFAQMIGVSVDTLQNWEQGRRKPVGPALALLKVAEKSPKAVLEALHA